MKVTDAIKGFSKNVPAGTKAISLYKGKTPQYVGTFLVEDDRDWDARFLDFHAANPGVYQTLVRLAREAKAKGHPRLGMKMLWEVMRWEFFLATRDIALNNNYVSRYARLIMTREHDLQEFFEIRRLHT